MSSAQTSFLDEGKKKVKHRPKTLDSSPDLRPVVARYQESMRFPVNIYGKGEDRYDALASQDALTYVKLCERDGVIEDEFLYERRILERELAGRSVGEELEEAKQKSNNIIRFLRLGGRLQEKVWKDTAAKRSLLRAHFPDKFGKGGTQDITGYSGGKVGALFNGVWDGYHKKYNH